jgi:transposase, IS5 family
MPIEKIEVMQSQRRLFEEELRQRLNPKNKLCKLRDVINWTSLEQEIIKLIDVKQLGRERTSLRIMLGLTMLQAMCNFSDCLTSEELSENMYWQYFCGYEYLEPEVSVSESTIRRFRDLLGEKGYSLILQELIRVGGKVGTYKKKDLDSVIIDTTVQIKNIKHPHEAYLLEKARKEIVKLCLRYGIKLNETYALRFKRSMIKLWKYKDASKVKKRQKIMHHMKVLLGRLIRIFLRKKTELNFALDIDNLGKLQIIKNIYNQSCLDNKARQAYKEAGHKIVYSFHAPEVECIGKGKLNKPYEFGNKVSIAVSGRGNFILGVKSFHGNPYDGHTLAEAIDQVESLTNHKVNKMFVDLGYRGNNYQAKGKVYTPYTKKKITPEIKRMQKRRSAIEPIIGHLKCFGRMSRNYLKGKIGDILNPLISAIGFNLRSLANKLVFAT